MKKSPSRTLFLLFEQYKTLAVPYFSILNRIEPQQHLISGFLIKQNPSSTRLFKTAIYGTFVQRTRKDIRYCFDKNHDERT